VSTTGAVLAISGGVGGAKLARGLAAILAPADLMIVANIGDDFEHLGLRICPDIDSLLYGLSGRNDEVKGWGSRDDSWNFMAALGELGGETWFSLGDRDLALHVERTSRLRAGDTLSSVTADFARAFGVQAKICPVSDDPLSTMVMTEHGEMPFQRYFVAEQCRPTVRGFRFEGAEKARLSRDVASGFLNNIDAIIICPSNPFVSVDPILAVPGFADLLRSSSAPIVAVSPIVHGEALKGPAAKMMLELGYECSALGIARYYQHLIDGIIVDKSDEHLVGSIRSLGIEVSAEMSVMKTDEEKSQLARKTLSLAHSIRSRKREG
jgi:LPPG:FO 2-phospho-L-lactate transferase